MGKIFYVITAFLLISNHPDAQVTYTWIGGASGGYTTNWLKGAVPATAPATTCIPAFKATSEIAANVDPILLKSKNNVKK